MESAMRYTEEDLSLILGEHEVGHLRSQGGRSGWEQFDGPDSMGIVECANQAAYNEYDSMKAYDMNVHMAKIFDESYTPSMTPEELLALLEDA